MAAYAVIGANGVVINLVEYEPGANWLPPSGTTIELAGIAGIGWKYANGEFTPAIAPKPTESEAP